MQHNEASKLSEVEELDVSEMSVGGEALSSEDKARSEEAMKRIRQPVESEMAQKVMDQYKINIEEDARRQGIEDWIDSDPSAKRDVLKNRALMKKATEEYERRQREADQLPSESEKLFVGMETPGAYQWPGEQNPDQPLENPVALELERELAILKIYQELKQSERQMEMYDREVEEKAADFGDDRL